MDRLDSPILGCYLLAVGLREELAEALSNHVTCNSDVSDVRWNELGQQVQAPESLTESGHPANPDNWEGVMTGYQLSGEDWKTLTGLVSGEIESQDLPGNILRLFEEAGLIRDGSPTDLAREWASGKSKEQKS